ncbi:MAG TPA: hypothetical protein VLH84_05385 [Patescibacteria group bacterium]|nr:hypothetical protein [Patescibacteria group bacterium]
MNSYERAVRAAEEEFARVDRLFADAEMNTVGAVAETGDATAQQHYPHDTPRLTGGWLSALRYGARSIVDGGATISLLPDIPELTEDHGR